MSSRELPVPLDAPSDERVAAEKEAASDRARDMSAVVLLGAPTGGDGQS